jgi:hypothetical protein
VSGALKQSDPSITTSRMYSLVSHQLHAECLCDDHVTLTNDPVAPVTVIHRRTSDAGTEPEAR